MIHGSPIGFPMGDPSASVSRPWASMGLPWCSHGALPWGSRGDIMGSHGRPTECGKKYSRKKMPILYITRIFEKMEEAFCARDERGCLYVDWFIGFDFRVCITWEAYFGWKP